MVVALESKQSEQVEELGWKLAKMGEPAVEAVRRVWPRTSSKVKAHLVWVLGLMVNDASSRLLLDIACQEADPNVASAAVGRLGNNRPINFRLSEREVGYLLKRVEDYQDQQGTTCAAILVQARQNKVPGLMGAIINRFKLAIKDRSERMLTDVEMAYLSPRVYWLNLYLLLFEKLGLEVAGALKAQMGMLDPNDVETRKWLTLALGMCGDESVAQQVRQVVEKDPDPYVRCVAVRAYARSAKQKAIPLLESLLNDNFVGEYGDCVSIGLKKPVYPIRIAAAGELATLRSQSNSQQKSGPGR